MNISAGERITVTSNDITSNDYPTSFSCTVKDVKVFGNRYTITTTTNLVLELRDYEINGDKPYKFTKAQINPTPKKNEPIRFGILKV
jgi:hypothetical protein